MSSVLGLENVSAHQIYVGEIALIRIIHAVFRIMCWTFSSGVAAIGMMRFGLFKSA